MAAVASSGRSMARSHQGSARSRPRTASAPAGVRPRSTARASEGRAAGGAARITVAIDPSRSSASTSRNQRPIARPHPAGGSSPRQASRRVACATSATRASGTPRLEAASSSHHAGPLGRIQSSARPARSAHFA